MRHLKKGRKLSRKRGQRRALLKILAGQLVEKEKIITTEAKAKELRSFVERLISCGKKQNLAALRLLLRRLPKLAAYKIFHELSPRYLSRKGGYLQIIKQTKRRKHDASKMAMIKLI